LKLINDLARLVGATPFFVGALELDALMAATSTLPALSATALMRGVADTPGEAASDWLDVRKLADRTFATATAPVSFSSPAALRAAALLNSANVLRLLDSHLEQLQTLRQAIAAGDETQLQDLLTKAAVAREQWLAQRLAADWEAVELPKKAMPTAGSMFKQMVGLGRWGEVKKDKK
jgi:prephenate dehydrogenase